METTTDSTNNTPSIGRTDWTSATEKGEAKTWRNYRSS